MELQIYELSNHLLVLVILVSSSNGSKVIDVAGKTLSRGTDRGMAYAKFKAHQFSYLNITTNIGSDYVLKGSECGLACVNIPSCFSFNLAAFSNIVNGKIFCELLPSDIYNNSKKFFASQFHHHYSITSSCISWPCQNNGTCVADYEENSYVCVCAKGYTGKYCETAIECANYSSLTSGDRKHTYITTSALCDDNLNGWYRFQGAAGNSMVTACPPTHRCNTYSPGWLNGGHPTVADGRVTRKVCFHYNLNCCEWSRNIEVRNCDFFFVYLFNGTSGCSLRFCGTA